MSLFCKLLPVNGQWNDLLTMNLKGKIKSVKETYYAAILNGNDTIEGERLLRWDNISLYDESGNLYKESSFGHPDGSYEWDNYYSYDSIGREIAWKCYSDTILFEDMTYKYQKSLDGYRKYWFARGNFVGYEDIRFNNNNQIVQLYNYEEDSSYSGGDIWRYLPDSLVVEQIYYDENDSPKETIKYTKNINGDNICVFSNKDNNAITYKYKYEEKMNWDYKIESVNNKPIKIVIRKIDYY